MDSGFLKNSILFSDLLANLSTTYHNACVKLGLSDSSATILYTLYCMQGDLPLNDLCRYCGLKRQTINSALRSLEKENVIFSRQIDGKSKRILLTEEGQKLCDRTVRRLVEIENDIYSRWPREDVEQYLRLTQTYLGQLKEKVAEL